MAEIRSVVSQVLSQLGTSREARYYLKQYSSDAELQFAVIKVGGAVLEEHVESLASALAFLCNLGLMPIILHARHDSRSDGSSPPGDLPRQPPVGQCAR